MTAAPKECQPGCAELLELLTAIAAGYKCEGKDDRYIVVENPDFQEDNGSNPNLVFDTWALAQSALPLLEATGGRERLIEDCAQIAEAIDSGRGNEKQIAKVIRALALSSTRPGGAAK